MFPSRPPDYLGAFVAAVFHRELAFGGSHLPLGCVYRKQQTPSAVFAGAFSFHPISRTDLTWTQENYYAKPVPRTGKVLSHPH